MRKIYLLFCMVCLAGMANAQVSVLLNPTYGYGFLNTATTYTSLGTGGSVFQAGAALSTDANSGAIALPFTFTFNGIKENTIYINNNGYITFAAAQSTAGNTVPLSTTTTSGYDGVIAGLANNLVAAASGTPEIRYGSSGGDFIVQFQDLAISTFTLTRITFQVILKADGKTIQVVYGPNNTGQASATGSQVGLRGTNDEDWNNRSLSSGGNWNTSGGAAGTINTSSMTWTASSTLPTSGRTFQWAPVAYAPAYLTTAFSSCQEFTSWTNGSGPNNVPTTNWATNGYGNASWQIDNTTASTTGSGWGGTSGAYSPVDYASAVGGHSARFHSQLANAPQVGYLDYYVNLSSATSAVSLDFFQINPSGSDILQVYLSTDGGTSFSQVGSNIGVASTWTARSINLGAIASATTIIRFKATSDFGSDDIGIDHLCLSQPQPPTLTGLGSTSGCAGTQLLINGTNLTGATASNITIGGTPVSSIVSNTGTALTVVVAGGSGIVSVTTAYGTATSSPSTFTVNPLPANPGNPTSNSPQCAVPGVTLTRTGTPGGSETWYWQSTAAGTTVTAGVNDQATYTVTTSGTYYIRSQSSLGCWSAGAGSLAVLVTAAVPAAAITPVPSNAATGTCYAGSSPVTSVSWAAVSGATSYDVYFGANSLPGSVTSNVATNAYTTGTLLANTTYHWKVVAKNLCGNATGSTEWTFTTKSTPCACTPTYTNLCSSADFINNYSIGNLSNLSTGCNGNTNNYIAYAAAAANTTTLYTGTSYNASVTIGSGGSGNVGIWIDFNDNGIFESTERYVNSTLVAASGTQVIPVAIAANATIGVHAMRVREVYSTTLAIVDPCTNAGYGETEDYFVTIAALVAPSVSSLGADNGCSGGSIVINGTDLSGATAVTVGGTPVTSITSNTSTQIVAVLGAGTTGVVSVTTPGGTATGPTFTFNAAPATVVVSGGGTFCSNTTISASNGGDGRIYYQGTTANGVSTTTESNTAVVTASGTYYFRAQSAQGCWGQQGSVVVVIQTPISTSATNASICQGGTGSLTATSTCASFTNLGNSIAGTWAATPTAFRLNSIVNSSACAFSTTVTRNYSAFSFQVSVTGAYTFEMNDNLNYDGIGYLVSGSFNPGSCASGTFIKGDDDGGIDNEPLITANLTTGVTYTLVSSTYSTSTGNYIGSFAWTVTGGQVLIPVSGNMEWYSAAVGGSPIANGSSFNPVATGFVNANTVGTTVFYAACSNASSCRVPVSFVVNPNAAIALSSAVGTDAQTVCSGASITPINYAVTGGGTGASITSGSLPTGVTGTYSAGVFTIAGSPAVPGSFSYTITTTGTCAQASTSGTLTVPVPFTATYSKTNKSACSGLDDGTITVTPVGGTAPYTYSWTGMAGAGNANLVPFSAGNLSTLTGLGYGFYNVSITDAHNCAVVTISNIHIENAYTVYVTNNGSISAACANTGSILLYGNAGVQPYAYSLDGITYQGSNTFSNLAPGSYTAYVKDAGGCITTKTVSVGVAAPVVVTVYTRNSSSCAADGSIELYRTGGIGPYTYSLDNVNYQSSNKFTNLSAGNFTGYVKDTKGCIGTLANIVVTQGAALTVTAGKSNTSSCITDGSFQLNASGGVAPYTYSKDGTNYQVSNSFTSLGAGTYTGWVKDSKGCTGSVNVTITITPIAVVAQVVNATGCTSNDGKITLYRGSGGVGPYTYSLDGDTYQTSNVFLNVAAGTYDGYVKDSKTCVGAKSGILVGPACPGPVSTKIAGNKIPAMDNVAKAMSIQAFPNPSATEFTLQLEGLQPGKVKILVSDLMGRTVYQSEGTAKQQYRFGKHFIAGMYTIQVIQDNRIQSIKLVKE